MDADVADSVVVFAVVAVEEEVTFSLLFFFPSRACPTPPASSAGIVTATAAGAVDDEFPARDDELSAETVATAEAAADSAFRLFAIGSARGGRGGA